MKVVVKDNYLNIRMGAPSVNAKCIQYLAPGSEIEVDGKLYPGDMYSDISTWYRDELNNYYWSGGVQAPQLAPKAPDNWWIQDYGIQVLWAKGLTGKGIKIAVLDTGVAHPHIDLDLKESNLHDVTQSASGYKDLLGHGTHCIGIIKASNNNIGPTGIAYGADLYSCKVTHDEVGDQNTFLSDAIAWAVAQKVDIISISKGSAVNDGGLEKAVNDAVSSGILVVAAAGNIEAGYPHDDIYYPARFDKVLSVGGVDESRGVLKDTIMSAKTKLFAPGHEILSTYLNNDYRKLSGSSQAAPFVAAVAALLLEDKRRTDPLFRAGNIKDILLNCADQFSNGKIINPKNQFPGP